MSVVAEKETEVLWEMPENQETVYVEEIDYLEPKPLYDFIKRVFDIVAGFAALVILLIPMMIVAIIIAIDSEGMPIYVQTRLGKHQKPFDIYKFRTMIADAEKNGMQWAADDDPRVTRFGAFLRRTRMDELPQLINIIKGDMSIVGPRPERPEFYDVFDRYIVGFRQRMMVKPGLTGYAQVNGGYELKPEEKIVYDVEYIKNRSVWIDIKCIFKTIKVIFSNEGAK